MIVQAAMPLLVEHGERVTTRQVADAAGIAEGTIFRVFDDKDALIQAVVDHVADPTPLDDAIRDLDPELPFDAALRAFVELAQRRAITIWQIHQAVPPRFLQSARHSALVSEPMVAFFKQHKARLSVSPAEAARLLRALTISLTHPALAEEPMAPKRIVELFLNGAEAR